MDSPSTAERSYAPTVSSPLNPTRCRDSPPPQTPKAEKGNKKSQRSHRTLSPTQRLLRQKAEAAVWKTKTIRKKSDRGRNNNTSTVRAGLDETRARVPLFSEEEERSTMDLEYGAGLRGGPGVDDEKDAAYGDYLVDLSGDPEYLESGMNRRRRRSGSSRHFTPPVWRVMLVIGLASVFSLLIPLLQHQLAFRLPPMTS